jgi:dTDP-4-amino-4,6-dideoxygalactose transaminase
VRLQTHLGGLGVAAHLYANASNGFKDFLVWIAARSGRERPSVVMPSYMPAKLLRAALASGCEVRFYEIHGRCAWDLADVEAQIGPDTIALFHVHYFGLPGPIEGMRDLATRRRVALVEDCALTAGATHRGRALGTFGDVALFSMRKVFLSAEGGALVVGPRHAEFRPTYERRVGSCYSAPRYLLQRAKYAYMRVTGGADPLHVVRPGSVGYMDGAPRQVLTVKRLSRFTQARLPFMDVDAAAERRRESFRYLLERFPASAGVEPMVGALPEGCTPYSFPVLVGNGARDELRDALLRDGILATSAWPESPFDPRHARTAALAAAMLELPIHQAITRAQLDRSLRCVEREVPRLRIARGARARAEARGA